MLKPILALTSVSALLPAVLVSGSATAAPVEADQADVARALMLSIEPESKVGGAINDWSETNHWQDFGSTRLDDDSNTVIVYAKSAPPQALSDVISRARSRYAGVTVKFVKSRYSSAELIAESQRILRADRGGSLELLSAGPDDTNDGLAISPRDPALLTGKAATDLVAGFATAYPVTLRPGKPGRLTASRNNDQSPFRGNGPGISRAAANDDCTVGIPVFYGASPNRVYGMLTAEHCGQDYFDTPQGRYIGRTHMKAQALDTQMIRGGGSYQAQLWSGNAFATSARWIRNGGNPSVGSRLYMGGAQSGDLPVEVYSVNQSTQFGDIERGPGFYFDSTQAGGCAVRPVDSGAAVFEVNSDDQSATIRGLQSSGHLPAYGDCYGTGFAINISRALVLGPGLGLVTQTSGTGP